MTTSAQAKALLALDMAIAMLKTLERGGHYTASEFRTNIVTIETAREALVYALRLPTLNSRGKDNIRQRERNAQNRAANHG